MSAPPSPLHLALQRLGPKPSEKIRPNHWDYWLPYWATYPSPLAGQNLSANLGDCFLFVVQMITYGFTCSAALPPRIGSIGFTPPGSGRFAAGFSGAMAAGAVQTVTHGEFGFLPTTGTPFVGGSLCRNVWPPATLFDITVSNLDAGDRIGAVSIAGIKYLLR